MMPTRRTRSSRAKCFSAANWAVMYMNGIRYLEKAPLHYWLVATSYAIAGQNAFTTRLPLALAVIALTLPSRTFSGGDFSASARACTPASSPARASACFFSRAS